MAKYCGGIKIDETMKIINGVICDANATTVDVSKAVSVCGQLWDGNLFTIADKVITLHGSEGEDISAPTKIKGNCGIGLDGRFFKLDKGVVSLQDGFVLTVKVTPADAIITVTDTEGTVIDPISGKPKQFLLKGIGDTYTVTLTKTGYTTQAKQVKNDGDKTLTVVLQAEATGD